VAVREDAGLSDEAEIRVPGQQIGRSTNDGAEPGFNAPVIHCKGSTIRRTDDGCHLKGLKTEPAAKALDLDGDGLWF